MIYNLQSEEWCDRAATDHRSAQFDQFSMFQPFSLPAFFILFSHFLYEYARSFYYYYCSIRSA